MEEAEQQKKRDLLSSDIQRIVRRHLGEAEQSDVAHQMVSSSSSSLPIFIRNIATPPSSRENSTAPVIVNKEGEQQKRPAPEDKIEPKGRRGRPPLYKKEETPESKIERSRSRAPKLESKTKV
jgi:hypothetical protein